MRRVVIRDLKNTRKVKPRLFDALVDGDDVYFEIKAKTNGSEIIALKDVMEQISCSESGTPGRIRARARGDPK